MSDVKKFNVMGKEVYVKDELSRKNSWLYGKKIVVYGDSTAATLNNYWTTMSEMFPESFELTNRAIGGTLLTNRGENNGITLIMQAQDLENFDIVFVCYGTNEWQSGHSDIYGTTNMFVDYCVREIIRKVQSLTKPPKLIFITPFFSYRIWGTNVNINPSGNMLFNYNYAICKEAEKFGCEYIDFFTTSGCNIHNYRTKLSDDSGGIFVHENKEFSKELATLIWNRCTNTDIELYPDNGNNMINNSDLWNATTTVEDLTSVKAGYACPPYMSIAAGTTHLTGRKTFTPGYYRFIGYSNGQLSIGISGKAMVELTLAGTFDFILYVDYVLAGQISFVARDKAFISGLRVFKVGKDPNMFYNTYNSPTVPVSEHAISGGVGGLYEKDNLLIITNFNLKAKNEVPANTALVSWNAVYNKSITNTFFVTMYNATKKKLFSGYVQGYKLYANEAIAQNDVISFYGLVADPFLYVSV